MKRYYVYMLASASGVLYTGVTNSLRHRIEQHRQKLKPGFTKRYNVTQLVHFEVWSDIRLAIDREKEIKAWRRDKKIASSNRRTRNGKTWQKGSHSARQHAAMLRE